MANRSFLPPLGALEVDVVELFGTITIGSTGAVSSSTGKGISTVVRNSAGKYTVTLTDSYQALLFANAVVLNSANSDVSSVGVPSRIFSSNVTSSTAPTIVFQFYSSAAGAAADPASGAVVYFMAKLRNSSVT